MSRTLKIIVLVNLLVIAILTFAYAQRMVAPGLLIKEHHHLNGNCFSCHTSFKGIDSKKCTACHLPADIGRLTTKGLPLSKPLISATFHKDLNQESCVSCHSDHVGVKRYQTKGKFDHALLKAETRGSCQTCHKPPGDFIHQQIKGNCTQCHTQKQWTPASFEHDKFFVLDSHHSAACSTCHIANHYKRYTCFGCHQHSLEKIRSKHLQEGIQKFEQCVDCHRSGDEDSAVESKGGEGKERD